MPIIAHLRALALTVLLASSVVTASLLAPGIAVAAMDGGSSSTTATAVDSCRVIDEPGYYELTTDLENDSTCIRIAASNVTLDGNGHTITGTSETADTAVLVRQDDDGGVPENVTVQNLHVEDWERGVAFRLANDAAVRNVTATNASIVLNHVDRGTVTESGVRNGTISATTSWDVVVRNTTLHQSSVELGSFVHGATVRGIDGDGASVSVVSSDNVTVHESNLSGISLSDVDDTVIAHNSPDETGRFGVWIDSLGAGTVTITGNTITGNVGDGDHTEGIRADAVHDLSVIDNRIVGNDVGVRVVSVADQTTHEEVCGEMVTRTDEGTVEIHGNDLSNNTQGVVNEGDRTVNTTDNYWGPGGPSSATIEPLEDPETGALADGDGSTVTEEPHAHGVSNVRFDPWLGQSPTAGDSSGDPSSDGSSN